MSFQTVFLSIQTLTQLFFLSRYTKFCSVFRLLDRKFNEESKNVVKIVTFLHQVSFTGNFISDCPFKLCFYQVKL